MLLLCTVAVSITKPLDVGDYLYFLSLLFSSRATIKIVDNHSSVGYYHMLDCIGTTMRLQQWQQ